MSRSGYSDDLDNWELIMYRGRVASAIRGKRGQKLLQDMLAALDAMPAKALITQALETPEGDRCALGVVGAARGIDMSSIDPEEPAQISKAFDIADALAREVAYENDEGGWRETPEQRWQRMRDWVVQQIKTGTAEATT